MTWLIVSSTCYAMINYTAQTLGTRLITLCRRWGKHKKQLLNLVCLNNINFRSLSIASSQYITANVCMFMHWEHIMLLTLSVFMCLFVNPKTESRESVASKLTVLPHTLSSFISEGVYLPLLIQAEISKDGMQLVKNMKEVSHM